MGPYSPAGPDWQRAVRDKIARRLIAVEIECPDAAALAAKWGAIMERPVQDLGENKYRVVLDTGAINFLPGTGPEAVFAGVELETAAPGAATVSICGVRFHHANLALHPATYNK
jgi:hypothetical protein